MILGEKISALRKQRGLSQEDLALMLTITRQAVSRWEQNESIPDVENITRLSTIFGVSTDYLLKDGEYTAVLPPLALQSKKSTPWVYAWVYERFFNSGFIYIVAAGVYLIVGFGFGWWHPGWIIFATLGITHGAMAAWFESRDDDDD